MTLQEQVADFANEIERHTAALKAATRMIASGQYMAEHERLKRAAVQHLGLIKTQVLRAHSAGLLAELTETLKARGYAA